MGVTTDLGMDPTLVQYLPICDCARWLIFRSLILGTLKYLMSALRPRRVRNPIPVC